MSLHERAQEAALAVRGAVPAVPRVAVVLGSGLGALVDDLADTTVLPYARIPHFPTPTVAGHHGNLVVGAIEGASVLVLQGRFHSYEGHSLEAATFPVRVLQALGVETLILTAATGGINASYRPGDIVVLSDHLNFIGANPLRGPNDERFGPRFPDMSEVYSLALRHVAIDEARSLGFELPSGVYAAMPGPSYETPAEIRMLKVLGSDVVGMSTVPEAIVARHGGMRVLAFAVVSNWAAGIASTPISHEEVLEAGRAVGPRLAQLIGRVVGQIGRGS
jgi:purine-nucleoside phosphorylase